METVAEQTSQSGLFWKDKNNQKDSESPKHDHMYMYFAFLYKLS